MLQGTTRKWGVVAKRPVNLVLDDEIIADLQRLSASRRESMSLIVRDALRSHFRSAATSGAQ